MRTTIRISPVLSIRRKDMEGCQNYGPFLGTLNIRGRIIIETQKGTIILTTTHMGMVSCTTLHCAMVATLALVTASAVVPPVRPRPCL